MNYLLKKHLLGIEQGVSQSNKEIEIRLYKNVGVDGVKLVT